MTTVTRIVFALLMLVAWSGAASAAGVPVTPQKLTRATAAYRFTIAYPRTGNTAIDAELAAWAKREAAEFADYTGRARLEGEERPWSLDVTYKIPRNDSGMFAVVFAGAMNDDGNHTHFSFTTFNYVMPGARRISISEVVAPQAFARMRGFAVTHMVSEDPDFGAEVADGGLDPQPETFEAFTVSPAAITVWFTPEQLGNMTSAGGHTVIPLTELKGLLRAPR